MVSWVRSSPPFAQFSSLITRAVITAQQTGAVTCCVSRCWHRPITVLSFLQRLTCAPATQYIRQWRHPNNRANDAETTNVSCPCCRVPSYFVTPSSQFFPKTTLNALKLSHTTRLAWLGFDAGEDCNSFVSNRWNYLPALRKHFWNSPPIRRHCPFGRNCSYRHLHSDGTPFTFSENSNVSAIYVTHF